MKKLFIILFSVSLLSVACMSSDNIGVAYADGPTYSQAFSQSKQNLKTANYATAEKDAQESLFLAKSSEETGEALVLLGEAFYGRKMYEEARISWSKATLIDDPSGKGFQIFARLGLGRIYKAQASASKAVIEYQAVLAGFDSKPNQAGGYLRKISALALANAYLEAGRYEMAKQQFNQIAETTKDKPVLSSLALYNIAKIDVLQKNFESALLGFNQILNMKEVYSFVEQPSREQVTAITAILPVINALRESKLNANVEVKVADDVSDNIDSLIDKVIEAVVADGY